MSLESTVSTILTRYRADPSEHKAAIKSLRGDEKARHQALLSEMEAQNRKIDSQIAMWGKVAAGVGGAVVAFQAAKAAARAYLEDVRLESAAAGANLDRLRAATNGLVEDDKLLEFAGKSMNGVWKLNQAEMETVLRGAMALRKTMGADLVPTIDKLTDAVTKGSTRALKDLGIEAKNEEEALRKLGGGFTALGGNVALAGDEMKRTGTKLNNSMADMQSKLGELALKCEPVIAAFAQLLGQVPEMIDYFDQLTDRIAGVNTSKTTGSQQRRKQISEMRLEAWELRDNPLSFLYKDRAADLERQADQLEEYANKLDAKAQKKARVAASEYLDRFSDGFMDSMFSGVPKVVGQQAGARMRQAMRPDRGAEALIGANWGGLGAYGGAASGLASGMGDAYARFRTENTLAPMSSLGGAMTDIGAASAEGQAAIAQLLADFEALDALKKEKGDILSAMFGTPSEIEEMSFAITAAAGSFNVLTTAAGAAFDAWITGSKSLGAAFSEAVAEGLKAVAIQMFIESLKHAAFGLGALAFGPIMGASAATHFAAAGKFAAGAAVAGIAARELGQATGQWSAGGAGAGIGAGGGYGGGRALGVIDNRSGAGDKSSAPINIYVGSEWAGLSSVQQSQAISRAIQQGRTGTSHIRRG